MKYFEWINKISLFIFNVFISIKVFFILFQLTNKSFLKININSQILIFLVA
jgi:hypothetical protein